MIVTRLCPHGHCDWYVLYRFGVITRTVCRPRRVARQRRRMNNPEARAKVRQQQREWKRINVPRKSMQP